jgi:uncharacterized protein
MNLLEKSRLVEDLFKALEEESKVFQESGEMSCLSGCGFCCANPKIPASPLEFLPLAFDLYAKGLAEEIANQLALEDSPGNCIVYRSQAEVEKKGFCGSYKNRGLICRLFGSSVRRNNKTGIKDLITCKILKENKAESFSRLNDKISNGLELPVALNWYTRISEIDEHLSVQYPVNQAILMALELVLRYKFYQEEEITVQS